MKNIDKYQMSAIIGFWRMGVDDAVISGIVNCELWEVFNTIKIYQLTIEDIKGKTK